MKKLLLFAAVAGLGLVSAAPPQKGPEPGAREARRDYPPCSRAVRDSCIQLHERGVRAHRDHHARGEHRDHRAHAEHRGHHADHRAHAEHRGHNADHRAHAEHRDHAEHRAHREHRPHRQHATADHRPARQVVRTARVSRQVAQRVRRAGERG